MSVEQAGGTASSANQAAFWHSERRQKVLVWLLAVVTLVLVGWALHAMGSVIVPIVFSIFVALIVAPVDAWVKRRVPDKFNWVGHVAAMSVVLVVLAIFFGALWLAAQRAATELPDVSQSIQSMIPESMTQATQGQEASAGNGDREAGGGGADDPTASGQQESGDGATGDGVAGANGGLLSSVGGGLTGAAGSLASTVTDELSGLGTRIISSAGATLAAMVLIFFFTLLMLIEAPKWRDKVATLMQRRNQHDVIESTDVIARLLRRYLLARTILGVITAVLYMGWLWIFGVDLLIVWGLLAFLLNFVPTVGSIIAGALPLIYAFFTKDLQTTIFIGIGLLVIEQVMGNFVDPRVQGRQLSLSSLVVLIALLLWGWIWGIPGALLAVPMTITIVIICAHIRPLRPIALLLSDERNMAGLDEMSKH